MFIRILFLLASDPCGWQCHIVLCGRLGSLAGQVCGHKLQLKNKTKNESNPTRRRNSSLSVQTIQMRNCDWVLAAVWTEALRLARQRVPLLLSRTPAVTFGVIVWAFPLSKHATQIGSADLARIPKLVCLRHLCSFCLFVTVIYLSQVTVINLSQLMSIRALVYPHYLYRGC